MAIWMFSTHFFDFLAHFDTVFSFFDLVLLFFLQEGVKFYKLIFFSTVVIYRATELPDELFSIPEHLGNKPGIFLCFSCR